MQTVIPTILTSRKKEFRNKLQELEQLTESVHLDVIDTDYADKATLQLKDIQDVKGLKNFKVGVHLMVKEPLSQLQYAQAIGAKHFIAQIEEIKDQKKYLQNFFNKRIRPGIAINLKTGLEKISGEVFQEVDIILVMLVKAGKGGQKMSPEALQKVKQLKKIKKAEGYHYKIAVDGGIKTDNIKKCFQAGAEVFFIGSAVWKNPQKQIKKFNSLVKEDCGNSINN